MKIAIISTSPRKKSNSYRVALAIARVLAQKDFAEVVVTTFENYDFPMVGDGDLQAEQLSPFQSQLIRVWEEAQLIFLIAPEYNWVTSGEVINAIHQLGNKQFGHLFHEKVFALCGVSNGRGGRQPALLLTTLVNKMISFLNKDSVVSPRIYESHETDHQVDEEGNLIGNEIYQKTLGAFVDYSLKVGLRWFR